MTNRLVLVLLAIILLLSFTPPISALSTSLPDETITQKITGYIRDFNFKNFVKGVKSGYKIHKYLKKLGLTPGNPQTNELFSGIGFFMTFYVGVNEQPVIAKIDINNQETFINNLNYKPGCAYTTPSPIDPMACIRYQNNYISIVDVFTFSRGFSRNSRFFTQASPVSNNYMPATATGVLSFNRNRNNAYSIVNRFHYRGFSYYFPKNDAAGSASINFTAQPGVNFNPSNFNSVPLLMPNNPGNQDLYYVPPPQILVGFGIGSQQPLPINPAIDFSNGVIIDTSVPYIMLAKNAYYKVVEELIKFQNGQKPVDTDPGIPICFYKPKWPILTLRWSLFLFGSYNNAQMVLRKDNYVATLDSETGLECAMIYESEGISKIGTIAQYNRNMIFDVDGSRLYFDQYPQPQDTNSGPFSESETRLSGYSGAARPTIAFILVVFYFIIFLLGL